MGQVYNTHIDMTDTIQKVIQDRANSLINRAILDGDREAMKKIEAQGSKMVGPSGRNLETPPYGERQVESLLRFVVEHPLGRAIEDAEADNIVYDGLGEHRILGKHKKKKQKKAPSGY